MQTYITLNDGTKIPQFGLGVYQVPEGEATYNAVLDALKMGVRHIDTAHSYQNERSVGKAVKDSGVPREEVWITTKLWPHEYGKGKTAAAIDKMLERLGTNYIDLLLLHQQFGDYLLTFGIIDGWTGIGQRGKTGKEISKEDNTVTRTLMEREVNPDFPKNMFIIYDTGYETICFAADENGKVYFIEDDFCEQRHDSLSEFLDYYIHEFGEE